MPLTLGQIAALRDIAAGFILERRLDRGVTRIDGPSHPSVIGRLISLKLAAWESRDAGRVAVLTADGERALKS